MANQGNKMNMFDTTLMAIGAIIGAGVFSMTGVAAGVAGPGVPLSFILAGVAVMFVNLPHMVVASAIPARGGQYLYVARFVKPVFGFLLVWNLVLETTNIAVLALTAGKYLPSVVPFLTPRLGAGIAIVAITTACLFNVKTSARVQNTMVILILLTLGLFVVMGIPHIKYWSFKDMFTVKGIGGIVAGVAYLRYAAYGAVNVIPLAGEIEDPGKTIPRAIGTSTLLTSLLYAFVAMVAVGVVPWEQMVGQPLSVAAEAYMPLWAFKFFVIGGALFAVLTTMLAITMDYSRAMWAAADDNLFPEWFQATNKYGVPHRIILLMGAIGLAPILLNMSLEYVFAMMNAPGMLLGLLGSLPVIIAPKKLPEKFQNAWFKLPYWATVAIVLINMGITIFCSYSLFATLDLPTILGIIVFYGGGTVYFYLRAKKLKKEGIDLEAQMSAYDPSWVSE